MYHRLETRPWTWKGLWEGSAIFQSLDEIGVSDSLVIGDGEQMESAGFGGGREGDWSRKVARSYVQSSLEDSEDGRQDEAQAISVDRWCIPYTDTEMSNWLEHGTGRFHRSCCGAMIRSEPLPPTVARGCLGHTYTIRIVGGTGHGTSRDLLRETEPRPYRSTVAGWNSMSLEACHIC